MKHFRETNDFVLYDENDNVVCYFNNIDELKKYSNVRPSRIYENFMRSSDCFINIVIDNSTYKLYRFEE